MAVESGTGTGVSAAKLGVVVKSEAARMGASDAQRIVLVMLILIVCVVNYGVVSCKQIIVILDT